MQRSEQIRHGRSSSRRSSWFAGRTPRILVLALSVAVIVGACDAYAIGDGGGSGAGGDLTLSIASPGDGATVSIPFDLSFESNVDLGAPESGNHHVHLFIDTDTSSSEYEIVYGSTVEVSRELAAGEHTIIASLRNADHSDAGASQTITVVVGATAGDGGSPAPVATPAGLGY